jgi:hypothetical protein
MHSDGEGVAPAALTRRQRNAASSPIQLDLQRAAGQASAAPAPASTAAPVPNIAASASVSAPATPPAVSNALDNIPDMPVAAAPNATPIGSDNDGGLAAPVQDSALSSLHLDKPPQVPLSCVRCR